MRTAILIPLLCLAATPALSQDSALQRCRVITDATARLACYDALPDVPSPRPVAAPSTPPASKPAVAAADSFGLPQPARDGQELRSAVGSNFSGWGPNSHIRLDNGQLWQVIDGSSVSLPPGARPVTIKRGALGSFYLDIDGLKTSPRVRRVQ